MPLIRLEKASLAYGHRPLLEQVDLEVRRGERVCLVGRNGEGKSSLLRLISGETAPDDGSVWRRPGVRIAQLTQEATFAAQASVFEVVSGGLPELERLLSEYHRAAAGLAHAPGEAAVAHLAELQHRLEAAGGWQLEQRIEAVLSRLGLDGAAPMHTLSGGWGRRALLARALVSDPDVLLLDEPTNHLDIEAIGWLEDFLTGFQGALLFVSHDRAFMRRLARRVVELDRGVLSSWQGGFDDYLRRKTERLAVEAQHNARFDKRLAQEEIWIRQGIKARRTRNEGRVRSLQAMREQRRQRRERIGTARLRVQGAERSGRLVFECEHLRHGFDGKAVVQDLSTRIMRGDRVGIVGPNGAGKSTLIRLILGELTPDSGKIRRGTRLEVAYFDQGREALDPALSVMDSVNAGSQTVTIDGRSQHVAGYLRGFLFPPERLQSPVGTLSGGERNRLLLARLFARPANLLVMDEPTNDLDVETLELLEELLMDYPGTLLLVSHDRAFLDNVVTSTLVFEGAGRVGEYVGGYTDWLHQARKAVAGRGTTQAQTRTDSGPAARPAVKLSYREQRELEALPARIETLETEQAELQERVSDSGFYRQPGEEIARALAQLETLNGELESAYARWEALESARPSR